MKLRDFLSSVSIHYIVWCLWRRDMKMLNTHDSNLHSHRFLAMIPVLNLPDYFLHHCLRRVSLMTDFYFGWSSRRRLQNQCEIGVVQKVIRQAPIVTYLFLQNLHLNRSRTSSLILFHKTAHLSEEKTKTQEFHVDDQNSVKNGKYYLQWYWNNVR